MRWLVLLVLAAGLAACNQTSNLGRQLTWGNGAVITDVSVTDDSKPYVYEAVALPRAGHTVDPVVMRRDLLLQTMTRMKGDGYDRFVVQGPMGVTLTRRLTQYGREIARSDNPGIKFILTGYKPGQDAPSAALQIDGYMTGLQKIKPGVNNI